jgi:FkbM family methyltransferase
MAVLTQAIQILRNWIPVKAIWGHTIVPRHLTSKTRVLDLGTNHGSFSKIVQKNWNCQIHCVEANEKLVKDLSKQNFNVIHAAAVGVSRSIEFNIMENDEASSIMDHHQISLDTTASIQGLVSEKVAIVEGLNYQDILKKFNLETCDLLKVDIEGAEIEFLDAMTDRELQMISQITIEFHVFMGYYPRIVSDRIISRIKSLGFYNLGCNLKTSDDVLLINKCLCPHAYWDWVKVACFVRPLVSLHSNLERILQDIVSKPDIRLSC